MLFGKPKGRLRFGRVTGLLIGLVFSMLVAESASASPFMKPRPMPGSGPWFDGWYVRVTDPVKQLSFATITTSATHTDDPLDSDTSLPGYIAFLVSENQTTRSVEFFPTQTELAPPGADWLFRAEGFGVLAERSIDLTLPSKDQIQIEFGSRVPWSQSWPDTWGPEGWATYVPFLPLGWWVESLGSPVRYRLKLNDGRVVEGQGFAHIERSWGKTFPSSWMWAQGITPDNEAHLALAGGPLKIGGVELESFLIGYKSSTTNLEIRPDQGLAVQYEHEIDSCAGSFVMKARNFRDRIEIRAAADPSSFAPVSIPTDEGYEPNRGKESFRATIEVRVFRDSKLKETKRFENAALEFGADYMKCPAPTP